MTLPTGAGPGPLPAPGWYADPSAPPGRSGRRYWDGRAWTGHVVADPVPWSSGPPTTPDGVPLASWGRRLGAYLLDGLVSTVLTLVVAFPVVREIFRQERAFLDRTLEASRTGARPPGQLDLYGQIYPQLLEYGAIALVVLVLYFGLSWRVWSATPGKLALGLRIRLRDAPGPLPWSTIARRLLLTYVLGVVLSLVPVVGSLVGLYFLLDGLWPLWDPRRQALHDKFARTNVVRV